MSHCTIHSLGATVTLFYRGNTTEEYVRQYVLRLLKVDFGFASADIGYEFSIKIGSSYTRADIVVFFPNAPHTQENVYIIIECKRANTRNDYEAMAQLKSYMAACLNARYGVVASYRWAVMEKTAFNGRQDYRPLPALMNANGMPLPINYNPNQPVMPNVAPNPYEFQPIGFEPFNEEALIEYPTQRNLNPLVGCVGLTMACFAIVAGVNAIMPTYTLSNMPAATNTWITFTPSMTYSPTPLITQTIMPTSSIDDRMLATLPPPPSPIEPVVIMPSATLPADARFAVVNAVTNVNLRASPSTRGLIITSLSNGVRLQILETNDDGSWMRVQVEGRNTFGWIAAHLVRVENP